MRNGQRARVRNTFYAIFPTYHIKDQFLVPVSTLRGILQRIGHCQHPIGPPPLPNASLRVSPPLVSWLWKPADHAEMVGKQRSVLCFLSRFSERKLYTMSNHAIGNSFILTKAIHSLCQLLDKFHDFSALLLISELTGSPLRLSYWHQLFIHRARP